MHTQRWPLCRLHDIWRFQISSIISSNCHNNWVFFSHYINTAIWRKLKILAWILLILMYLQWALQFVRRWNAFGNNVSYHQTKIWNSLHHLRTKIPLFKMNHYNMYILSMVNSFELLLLSFNGQLNEFQRQAIMFSISMKMQPQKVIIPPFARDFIIIVNEIIA